MEHVLLGTESYIPELLKLVTEYVFLLNKVSAKAWPVRHWSASLLDKEQLKHDLTFIILVVYPLSALRVLSGSAKESDFIT